LEVVAVRMVVCVCGQVLYIDYGDSEWVATERIRQIDPTFIHRPSQAVHCRLPYRPLSADGTWTTQSQ